MFDSSGEVMDTRFFVIEISKTNSTQDEARNRFDGDPILVVTGNQVQGRGRNGAVWEGASRASAASLMFRSDWHCEEYSKISVATAACVAEVFDLDIKWPNDLLRGALKVGGILIEVDGRTVIIGVGLNLWWAENRPGWGSLFDEDPGEKAVLEVAKAWASPLISILQGDSTEVPIETFRKRCVTIGQEIEWSPRGSGTALGIDPSGGLIVRTEGETKVLMSGEVRHIRRASN